MFGLHIYLRVLRRRPKIKLTNKWPSFPGNTNFLGFRGEDQKITPKNDKCDQSDVPNLLSFSGT